MFPMVRGKCQVIPALFKATVKHLGRELPATVGTHLLVISREYVWGNEKNLVK
jgi:hypothetical protein